MWMEKTKMALEPVFALESERWRCQIAAKWKFAVAAQAAAGSRLERWAAGGERDARNADKKVYLYRQVRRRRSARNRLWRQTASRSNRSQAPKCILFLARRRHSSGRRGSLCTLCRRAKCQRRDCRGNRKRWFAPQAQEIRKLWLVFLRRRSEVLSHRSRLPHTAGLWNRGGASKDKQGSDRRTR